MKTTVIFDLDGTLLYTLEDLTDSVNYALRLNGMEPCGLLQIRSFVGNGIKKLMERAVSDGLQNPCFEKCFADFKEHYKDNMLNKTCPYDGTVQLLEKLKSEGIKIAVVSNKHDSAVKDLCRVYFKDKIDEALGESEKIAKKPSPDGVYKVINDFDENLENCVFVGDSEVDIITAKNAGIKCITVDWGYKDREFLSSCGAEVIVSSCTELYEEILK